MDAPAPPQKNQKHSFGEKQKMKLNHFTSATADFHKDENTDVMWNHVMHAVMGHYGMVPGPLGVSSTLLKNILTSLHCSAPTYITTQTMFQHH